MIQIIDENGKVRKATEADMKQFADMAAAKSEVTNWMTVPTRTLLGLTNFSKAGLEPGDFLYAVLTKDYERMLALGDAENLEKLPAIMSFCVNMIPAGCWGSREKVDAWVRRFAEELKEPYVGPV